MAQKTETIQGSPPKPRRKKTLLSDSSAANLGLEIRALNQRFQRLFDNRQEIDVSQITNTSRASIEAIEL